MVKHPPFSDTSREKRRHPMRNLGSMRLRFIIPLLSHTAVIMTLVSTPAIAQTVRPNEVRFREARHKEEVEGDLQGAIKLYRSIVAAKGDRSLAARALVHLGRCYEKQGDDDAR